MLGLPAQQARQFDADDFQIPLRTQSTWGWYRDAARPAIQPGRDRDALRDASRPVSRIWTGWACSGPPTRSRRSSRRARGSTTTHDARISVASPLCDRRDAASLDPSLIEDARTELDLWSGESTREYSIAGERVTVTTVADPRADRFAVRVESSLLVAGWGVAWVFDSQPDDLAWFEASLREDTTWRGAVSQPRGRGSGRWNPRGTRSRVHDRSLGVGCRTCRREHGGGDARCGDHTQLVTAAVPESDDPVGYLRGSRGGGHMVVRLLGARRHRVSCDGSTDPRAWELERRIVLSQYLLAVNSAGATPPAETGLIYNTWTGKFHLEMHWWHAAQFPLWGAATCSSAASAGTTAHSMPHGRPHDGRAIAVRGGRSRRIRRRGSRRATSACSSSGSSPTSSTFSSCCGGGPP